MTENRRKKSTARKEHSSRVTVTKTEKAKPWLPAKWDKEADIVVLGRGAAGMIAAITAHDLGAKVLVLEKAPEEHAGGNSLCNWGGLFITRDPAKAFSYLSKLNWGATSSDVIRVFVERVTKQEDYYVKMGFPIEPSSICAAAEYPEVEGSEAILWGKAGNGKEFMRVFTPQVKKRGIEVLYETPAKRLVQDGETRNILGVVAERNGSEIYVKAAKAVVLCTGGFEHNAEMILQYIGYPFLPSIGSPYNTGDGIRMAQDVGADLWHMNFFADCLIGFKPCDLEYTLEVSRGEPPGGAWITVDKHGKRYMSEIYPHNYFVHACSSRHFLYFDPVKMEYPRVPSWRVTDETGRLKGPWGPTRESIQGWAPRRGYEWSEDNVVEISKGWVLKSNTIEDLAAKMKVNPAELVDTVSKWNKDCEEGKDSVFDREPESMAKIEKPPFYAIELRPYFLNTQGGPRRNAKSQVVDTRGDPIRRLYVAGECGSVCGLIYQNSENMAECFVFGQIAAENAVKEKPW